MAIKRVFQPTIDDKISYEHIDAWVDYSMESLNENTNKLTEALIKNSKSSDFLAKVGIFIGIVGLIITLVGTIYGILGYIK